MKGRDFNKSLPSKSSLFYVDGVACRPVRSSGAWLSSVKSSPGHSEISECQTFIIVLFIFQCSAVESHTITCYWVICPLECRVEIHKIFAILFDRNNIIC